MYALMHVIHMYAIENNWNMPLLFCTGRTTATVIIAHAKMICWLGYGNQHITQIMLQFILC